ncbi:hypothetical protein LEP1GSC171_1750 [Leptospira santarosai str. HAI1380]|uniref:Uncharacterized protein n=1 Tax=Leptospira santarosai str. ZUN179 TaxID=1049985 RepID=M6V214_9LEPT|nr:hypothetical protein LEP1GSC163_3457 [Leptospira santarosai str. CBC379]EMO43573.1 hypothetical protein LEP1GSC187_2979 [Leptospira santarosai str. ZUN179]EMP04193.1 hypothetical protein LEP1GSC171_1750 [Leptospira santarosai str. HAI1380]
MGTPAFQTIVSRALPKERMCSCTVCFNLENVGVPTFRFYGRMNVQGIP